MGLTVGQVLGLVLAPSNQGTSGMCCVGHTGKFRSHSSLLGSLAPETALVPRGLMVGQVLGLVLAAGSNQGTTGKCCVAHTGKFRSHSSLLGSLAPEMALVPRGLMVGPVLGLVLVLAPSNQGTSGMCCVGHTGKFRSHSSLLGSLAPETALVPRGLMVGQVLGMVLAAGLNQGTTGMCCVGHTGKFRSHSSLLGSLAPEMALVPKGWMNQAPHLVGVGTKHRGSKCKCPMGHKNSFRNLHSQRGNMATWMESIQCVAQ